MCFVDRGLYRQSHGADDLVYYRVTVGQTDLHVATRAERRREAYEAVKAAREPLERYIGKHPGFAEALVPLPCERDAPPIVTRMCVAAAAVGVGPMAAVAGAIAEMVGEALGARDEEVIVENGGDLFISSAKTRYVTLFAGASPLSGKMAIALPPGRWGVATSAGTFGHSLSFGCADAAAAVSHDAALADSVATALGNRLHTAADIEAGLSWALGIEGVCGAVCIIEGALGVQGEIKLLPVGGA